MIKENIIMDFDFTEEQNILKMSARRFLEKECPMARVRELWNERTGYSPELWKKMANLGWMGMTFPLEFGGSGSTFLDLVLLQEEIGRTLLPSPFLPTVLAGRAISRAGSDEQKNRLLPAIGRGDYIISMPFHEFCGRDTKMEVSPKGEDFIINGKELFIPYAYVADYLLCSTGNTGRLHKEEGGPLFLVDAKHDGLEIAPLETTTGEKLFEVSFHEMRVPRNNILREQSQGRHLMESIMIEGAIAECGAILGGAQRVLEMTVEYAKQRIQFGSPIGSFQAIQHKCSDMLTAVDGATYITYQAAWEASMDVSEAAITASKAKAWCSDMYRDITNKGIQVLGGMGFTQEHDMQLFFRRARASELAFGDGHYHRERLARMMNI